MMTYCVSFSPTSKNYYSHILLKRTSEDIEAYIVPRKSFTLISKQQMRQHKTKRNGPVVVSGSITRLKASIGSMSISSGIIHKPVLVQDLISIFFLKHMVSQRSREGCWRPGQCDYW